MDANNEIELLLDQTVTALQEISAAMNDRKIELPESLTKALANIAAALSKRESLDITPIIKELRALREVPAIQVMPAPVQFMPSPDAVYEVEVHQSAGGKQRMTITKSTK